MDRAQLDEILRDPRRAGCLPAAMRFDEAFTAAEGQVMGGYLATELGEKFLRAAGQLQGVDPWGDELDGVAHSEILSERRRVEGLRERQNKEFLTAHGMALVAQHSALDVLVAEVTAVHATIQRVEAG